MNNFIPLNYKYTLKPDKNSSLTSLGDLFNTLISGCLSALYRLTNYYGVISLYSKV